jgi:putative tricarboxylic transport membrane protein
MEQQQDSAARRGLSHSAADAITAIIIFIVGVVVMFDNYKIGAGWASDGPESGYFPFRIGVLLCVASAVVAIRSLFGKNKNQTVFVTWDRFKLVLQVLLPTTVYVLAIQFLGIYVASTFFIGAFMRAIGKSGWLKTVAVSVGVSAVLFWMFEIQFMVPLPKGPLEALFGY